MDKSDDAPLSRSEFVKILLSTPSNCELRCQVLKYSKPFGTQSACSMSLRCVVRKIQHGILVFIFIYIYLYLYLFQLMLICLWAFYRALHRLQVSCSCSDWFVALSGSVMIFFLLSLVPRPVRAIRVTRGGLEPSANPRRIFLTSLTGGFTSEIAEDDWERSCLFLHFPSS